MTIKELKNNILLSLYQTCNDCMNGYLLYNIHNNILNGLIQTLHIAQW